MPTLIYNEKYKGIEINPDSEFFIYLRRTDKVIPMVNDFLEENDGKISKSILSDFKKSVPFIEVIYKDKVNGFFLSFQKHDKGKILDFFNIKEKEINAASFICNFLDIEEIVLKRFDDLYYLESQAHNSLGIINKS